MSTEYYRTAINVRDEYLRRVLNALEELNLQVKDPNVNALIEETRQVMQNHQ